MKIRNFLYYATLIGIISTSCTSEKKFHIKGQFSSTDNETIYLEHRSLGGIELIDSTNISPNGDFKFKASVPSNPEFYQLRVNNKIAVFSVEDESDINLSGDLSNFNQTFKVENSLENDQLKTIDMKTRNVRLQLDNLEKEHTSKILDDIEYLNSIDSILGAYKSEVSKIVLGNPSGAAAYYAIFQKINNYLIFDPYDRKDYQMYGAVATSWNKNYADTERSKHLYDFTMNALKVRKRQEQQAAMIENAPVVTNTSLPDISLKAVDGKSVSLSSLKGKVVILDFTVYNSELSPKHNILLNNVYTQLKAQDVEIYQISFDSDEHFWKNAAINLPWIAVRDPESVYSRLLSTYNVREVPTAFVLDKSGDVVARIEDYNTLVAEVRKVM